MQPGRTHGQCKRLFWLLKLPPDFDVLLVALLQLFGRLHTWGRIVDPGLETGVFGVNQFFLLLGEHSLGPTAFDRVRVTVRLRHWVRAVEVGQDTCTSVSELEP